jgi:hypothetical protein
MRCPDVSGGVAPSSLTVNQPSYDFEGSSPSSPTSLRLLRKLRLGKPYRSEGCRGVAQRAKPGFVSARYGSASHLAARYKIESLAS